MNDSITMNYITFIIDVKSDFKTAHYLPITIIYIFSFNPCSNIKFFFGKYYQFTQHYKIMTILIGAGIPIMKVIYFLREPWYLLIVIRIHSGKGMTHKYIDEYFTFIIEHKTSTCSCSILFQNHPLLLTF